MVSLGIPEEIVQEFEVVVIVREENSLFEDAPVQVGRVFGTHQTEISGQQYLVPGRSQQSHEERGRTVVIQLQFHRCVSRWCSSGDSTFGVGWYL